MFKLCLLASLFALPVMAQNQVLPQEGYEYPLGLNGLTACQLNVSGYLNDCAGMPTHAEAQIGAQIKCRSAAWRKFFVCTGLVPCEAPCTAVRRDMFIICE